MVAKCQLTKGLARNRIGIGLIRAQPHQNLCPHAVQRILIETWLLNGLAQKLHHLIAVFGQETGGDRDHVLVGVIREIGRQSLHSAGVVLRAQLSCTLFQQAAHQMYGPAFAGRVQ